MNLISIILPYFRKRFFIEKTINSIISQKYKNFEVIIIYDQHDDDDADFIIQLIKNDKRFKLYKNYKNYGVSFSRNKGINLSKGEYLCFLYGDDIWDENKLEIQFNFMKKNNILISHTSYKIINNKDQIIGSMKVKKNIHYNQLLRSCDIGLSTVMFNRKIINIINFPEIATKEDYVLWLRIVKKVDIIGISDYLTYWRKLNNSLSSSITQSVKNGFLVYYKFENKNLFISLVYFSMLIFFSIKKKIKQKIYKNI